MKRTYRLILDVEGPDYSDLDLLDNLVERVVQRSSAREAIDAGIFGTCGAHRVDVTSLRVEGPGVPTPPALSAAR
jgi:hypothetical protein